MSQSTTSRRVARVVRGTATSDGAGVKLTRVIGQRELDMLDPFLLLDEFGSDEAVDYIAGFPDHPHRGFETVTYMLAGRMRHGDNHGNSGLLVPGGVQWMTAGRGIVHSEMPEQEHGRMAGFQLWVNLPARDKMTAPRYQDIAPERIPLVEAPGGARLRVVAGQAFGARGPVEGIATEPLYLDVALPAGAAFELPLPAQHAACAYVFEGAGSLAGQAVVRGQMALLGEGEGLEAAAGNEGLRFLVLAARPLREPIARYGPFVMNTEAEIRQALRDLQQGTFLSPGV